MTAAELLAYAEAEIARLNLGDSPTNCHGVAAYEIEGDAEAIRLSDGVGLDVIVRNKGHIDVELSAMAEYYAESN